jgi:hypothetical protein
MPAVLTCPQGHQWQAELGQSCPVCGALTQTLPPSGAPGQPAADPETLPPAAADEAVELCRFLAPSQGPDEIGRLGNYRVLAVLGHGGMGVVFKAEDLTLKRLAAVKAMLPGLAALPANRQRFLREAQTAAAIEHDHIVPIYQVGEDQGVPFLVMPLLRGESLNDRLRREPRLPAAEVLHIGRETAEGLAAAHERGLIHRDIKPANLWLEARPGERGGSSPRPRVRILDFGLARAAAGDTHLTATGAILGTPAYMAPEQAAGKPVDGRCDLFSLGCVLYQLCTGTLPFRGSDAISTLMAVAMEQPPPPLRLNPELPPALSALVMGLLAKDPADRPATARDVVRALALLERDPAAAAEQAPVLDVLPAGPEASRGEDQTAAVLDALPAAGPAEKAPDAARRKRERDTALTLTGAFVGALVGAVVGLPVGLLLGLLSDQKGAGAVGAVAGLVVGALAGALLGPIVAGAYDEYLKGERELRKRQQPR